MTIIDKARKYDLDDNPVEAFNFYLSAIEDEEAGFDDYISASVLAFLFQDYGFSYNKKVPKNLIEKSWVLMHEILDLAKKRFGESDEINFWKNYYKLILEGDNSVEENCKSYLDKGFLLAVICFSPNEGNVELIKAKRSQLYESLGDCVSEKERYIKSILESNVF